MSHVNEDECAAAGVNPKQVDSIARRLSRAAKDAAALGITIFGGSGTGSLRQHDARGPLILAELDGACWDGGDGAASTDVDGLLRGETA